MNPLRSVYDQTRAWADNSKVEIYARESLESTNNFAKENLDSFDQKLTLVTCDQQTKGRGRGDHSWTGTAPGFSLYCTWVYRLKKPPQPISSPIIGVAVYEAFKKVWPKVNWSIKAPNDIYINEKKICGILIESVTRGDQNFFLVGIGANILKHPLEIDEATDLVSHLEEFITKEQWSSFLSELKTLFNSCQRTIICKELEKADQFVLKKALNACPFYKETVKEVTPDGSIVFETSTINWFDL